ncbi:radical SAM superfamily enzyme [Desulfitobacterium dehalogenans ATCC 51507]|uniref:Radical SAM superfamily enzyme n=1 Tax=Desulfitobacterium dehalogenans (strain ATCC 51507 / DSM 9161 / JW/IU-DC1) TaxID=756499 RepID=I4ADS0_DESDJ|nr:radical SAM/SPASM domain-containing protein [Desulfitobacterium dehalogenans]AFM02105.1 radical SAM superfamily enzyme [Desulfitobacterium dehalogenans ATCC 51507]
MNKEKEYLALKKWDGKENLNYPIHVMIEVSNACNIRCAMCNIFSPFSSCDIYPSKDDAFIDVSLIKKNFSFIKHAYYISLFGYGEPLIHPHFTEILNILSKSKAFMTFFTNGQLLSPEMAKLLVDKNIGKITISFSGTDKETYENIYIGARFEKTLENIKYLSTYKKREGKLYPIIEVSSVGFQKHVEKLDEFVILMNEAGVNHIRLNPLYEYSDSIPELYRQSCVVTPKEKSIIDKAKQFCQDHNIFFEDNLSGYYSSINNTFTEEELRDILSGSTNEDKEKTDLYSFKNSLNLRIKKNTMPFHEYYKRETHFSYCDPDGCYTDYNFKCYAEEELRCTQPHTVMYIRQDGSIKPCCNFPVPEKSDKYKLLGSLKSEKANKVWRGNSFKILRNNADHFCYPEACMNCIKVKAQPPENAYEDILATWNAYYSCVYKSN